MVVSEKHVTSGGKGGEEGGEAVVSCGPRLDQSGRSYRLVDACP